MSALERCEASEEVRWNTGTSRRWCALLRGHQGEHRDERGIKFNGTEGELSTRAVTTLRTTTVLAGWTDGDELGWQAEFDYLASEHAESLDALASSIQEVGIREPIHLGTDGRVWDGHHRLAVAQRLGLESVPVHFVGARTGGASDA